MRVLLISLPLILSCVIPVIAQSPQNKLLARRAAGVDGYRNLANRLQQYFKIQFPGASTEYFSNIHLRGAKRNSFRYTIEGCFVDMELPVEFVLEALEDAAQDAEIEFSSADADKAAAHFQGGLKVIGFGKFRGSNFKKPLKKRVPLVKPPPIKKKAQVKEFIIEGKQPNTRPSKKLKDIEEELDIFIESEKRTPFKKRDPGQSQRDFKRSRDWRGERSWRRDRSWREGPIRTYEWETTHSAETIEELDRIIESAIDDALKRWGRQNRSTRDGWRKIRTYTDPETGAIVEEYIRENESTIIE